MRKTIVGIAFCSLFGINGFSQQTKLVLKLKPNGQGSAIHLRNYNRGIDISIPPDGKGNFKGKINLPGKGFYTLDRVGQVYLEPGKSLEIAAKDSLSYTFKGKQARENELLTALKTLRMNMIPLNQVIENTPSYALLRQTVPEFTQTLKTYKDSVAKILSQSDNPFFRELALGDTDSYTRLILVNFSVWHGADSLHYADLIKFMNDPKSKEDPNYERKKMRAMYLPTLKGFLNGEDKTAVKKMYSEGFEQNDINLLSNSDWYGLVLSTLLFTDQPIDQKKMKESYLQRFRRIETDFSDKRFANYLIAQQGIEYMNDANYTTTGFEPVYQTLKSLDLPLPSKEMIEKAYRKMKNKHSL
jgi:hypothetical protein